MSEQHQVKAPTFGTLNEEIANIITHGIGAGMSIVGLTVLVVLASWGGDVYRIVATSIYGGSLVLLYIASTLYHAMQRPEIRVSVRDWFLTFDQVAIYILIAGTYTPLVLVKLRGQGGWTILIIVWTMALIGSIFKWWFRNRFMFISLGAYLVMGWMSIFLLNGISEVMGSGIVTWVIAGGIFYSLGVIPFVWRTLPYNHAIWHLFVIAGSICHYFGVLLYVMPEG